MPRARPKDTSPEDPQATTLHRIVREHLETFLARRAEQDEPMPRFVVEELQGFLKCGVLACGAVRFRCSTCGQDRFVALSCRGRGFCPRCLGRRMTETARHWVRSILPKVRIRQWVLSLPFSLRVPLAYHHDLLLAVHTIAARVIEGFYLERARALGIEDARTGSTTAVQRFGSDLALNVHFHTLLLDGVYDSRNKFTPINPPSREQMHALCTDIAARVAQYFEERATDDECEPDERPTAHPLPPQSHPYSGTVTRLAARFHFAYTHPSLRISIIRSQSAHVAFLITTISS